MRAAWQSLDGLIREAAVPLGERVVIRRRRTLRTMVWEVIWTQDDDPFGHRRWVLPAFWKIHATGLRAFWQIQNASSGERGVLQWVNGRWQGLAPCSWDRWQQQARQAFVSWLRRVPPPNSTIASPPPFHNKMLWIVQAMVWALPFLFWRITAGPAAVFLAGAGTLGAAGYVISRGARQPVCLRIPAVPERSKEAGDICLGDAIAQWEMGDGDAPVHALFELLQQWLLDSDLPFFLHARAAGCWDLVWTGGGSGRPDYVSISLTVSGYAVHWHYDVYDLEGNCLPISQAMLIWSGKEWLYRNQPLQAVDGFLMQLRKKLMGGEWRQRFPVAAVPSPRGMQTLADRQGGPVN